MYIYNVTINVDNDINDKWLNWMKEKHIPQMLSLGKFTNALMSKVMVNEENGITYSVQYTTDSKETLEKYYVEDASTLRKEGIKEFGEKFVAFRTELDVIHIEKSK